MSPLTTGRRTARHPWTWLRISHPGAQDPCFWGPEGELCFPKDSSTQALPLSLLGPIVNPGAQEGTTSLTRIPREAHSQSYSESFERRPVTARKEEAVGGDHGAWGRVSAAVSCSQSSYHDGVPGEHSGVSG